MGKKSGPKAPDPYKVSEAQTQSNKETAAYNASLNRINQSSPFGSINYTQTGTDPTTGAPMYSQETQLSPELQQLLTSQIGTQQGLSGAITGALGRLPGQFDASGINTDDIAKTSYERQAEQLRPQFEEGWRNLEGTMSDRGIPIGSEVWNNETNRYDTARDTALSQASRQAQLDATNEAQRQYGNLVTEYNLPLGTLSTLMGNAQGVQNPSFSNYAQSSAPATDVSGNVWNSYNAQVQQANQNNSNLWGGALGLGKLGLTAASMFSDRRVKDDIEKVGRLGNGLPVYRFRYKGSPTVQIGLMAQDVELVKPEAVGEWRGIKTVNYDLATAA